MSETIWREVTVGRVNSDITTFVLLSDICRTATKLWNKAMWSARQQWSDEGTIPTDYELQKRIQGTYWYRRVQSHVAQKAIHGVYKAFRSWFQLRKVDPTARPPGYRRRDNLSTTTFDKSAFRIDDDGAIRLSLGKGYIEETEYPNRFLRLNVRWWRPLRGEVAELRLVPRKGYFEVHATERLPEPEWRTEGQIAAIDLGEVVPIALSAEDGTLELYKGGAISSTHRYWNKEIARVEGQVKSRSKGRRSSSPSLRRMKKRGSRQSKHIIHAMTTTVSQWCHNNDVKEVAIGDLGGIKKDKKTGKGKGWNKKAAQRFYQMPLAEIVVQLRYKLARSGIRLAVIDERGTSTGRCSCCGATARKQMIRTKRGRVRCRTCDVLMHSDVNGTMNIFYRYLHQSGITSDEGSSGSLAEPLIRRWDGHRWNKVVNDG